MTYPDNCIKGIKSDDSLTEDRLPQTHLFYWQEPARDDGWREQSINWQDDPDAIQFTLRQTREDNGRVRLRYREGVAIIPKASLDFIAKMGLILGHFSYERDEPPDDNNPYHGNLLLRSDTPKSIMVQTAGCLAAAVSSMIPQPNEA